MQVGTIIKSFDFPGNTSCYMIGEVVGYNKQYGEIVAKTIRIVFDGKVKDVRDAPEFRTVEQGRMFMDDAFERVVVVG